jgi:NADH dehydrogenase
MHVLLVGGSGFVGSAVATELLDRGHDVTVLSRTPEDDVEDDDRVSTMAGDVTEYDSIESAFAGVDAVVNFVALSPLFTPAGGEGMHDEVHRAGTENVCAAAHAHGVDRLVQVSALGADPDGPTAYLRAKGEAERIVRDCDVPSVVVRPSVVFGAGGEFVRFTRTLTTPYVTGLPGGGSTRFQPIWIGDLAPILADCVEDDDRVGATFELGGPEVVTLADVTRLVYRSDGKPVRVLPVPMALARVGLTVGGLVPGFPMGPDQYRSLRLDNTVAENDVAAFDRDPGDLRTLADSLGLDDTPDGRGVGDAPSAGLRSVARGSAAIGAFAGVAGSLFMLGAFGPVSCSTSRSTIGDGVTTVSRNCNAGIDYLFGAGGNAPVLFFWSIALLALVALGTASAWTNRVALTWLATALGAVVTIVGVFSIGWTFLVPTIAFLAASVALTVSARRSGGTDPAAS